MGRSVIASFACLAILVGVSRGQELPKPTEEHKELLKDVGKWDATIKIYSSPGEDPQESKGTEVIKAIGEFWIIGEFSGEVGGMECVGAGTTGFDPAKKKFTGTWVDSMTPSIMFQEGTYDEKTKEVTMLGDSVGMDGKPAKVKTVSKRVDPDTRQFSMSMKSEATGPDFVKMMEITYKRAK
jgi:hypothetical protein